MKIENITRITDGILQNFPSVDQINSIKMDPLKVERGDLFFDIKSSFENQKCAIEKGAYAIISEKITNILDNEVAWIEVDSLRLACIKLSRYEFSKKNSEIICLDDDAQEIMHIITKNKEFQKLPTDVYQTLVIIKKSGENIRYTCSDKRLAHSIDPSCKTLEECFNIQFFTPKSPFFSSFTCKDKFYYDIKIPNIFVQKLCMVIQYLTKKKIPFDVHNISMEEHFSPIFIDFKLNKKDFGQSSKVIIFENNMDFIDSEIKHLKYFSKDFIICIPKRYTNCFSHFNNSYFFVGKDDLKSHLNKSFRYALIFGEKKDYEELFTTKKIDMESLFL